MLSENVARAERLIAKCRKSRHRQLDLEDLGLLEVPESIRSLRQLHSLKLSKNRITSIPAWICELTELKRLWLPGNLLQKMPASIGKLRKLQELVIFGGSPAIAHHALGNLASLQVLVLAGLGLRRFPEWIRNLRLLRSVSLFENSLTSIPNWISELTELSTLDVSYNRIRSLSTSLRDLKNLEDFSIIDNPDLGLPEEILRAPARRVLNYYFRTAGRAAGQPLNEFKLVLVGRGGVGKTTLVHKLVVDKYKTFRRTPGIQITKWPVTLDGEEVRAHVWDFGGQEIMHGTHRFFMTERALYLVLVSGREGTEDRDAEYWLSLVRSFAGDVPVIVLLHKWSDFSFELNRALLQEKYGPLGFLTTDSETGHGIAALRDEIKRLARSLPGLKASWPTAWREIKDELPRQKRKWLTFEDFCSFCAQRGVAPRDEQESLADSLHDLGLMLSYRHDETLRKFGVLNPQWVTQGIYQMLNSPTLRNAKGTFTQRSFQEVLPAKAYPKPLHPFLLALMIKFRLCHPLDDRGAKYLIPELLGKEEPPLESEFPPKECLSFVYHYTSVLPEGLLPRFIVDSYVHREPKLAWRSGVVLERANCRALIRGDLQARTVTIRVAGVGNGRRELLGIIREHFERIHRSFEKLAVTAKVPIPGHPEVQVDHDELLTYEREGEQYIKLVIDGRVERFEAAVLLDGIDLPRVRRSTTAVAYESRRRSAGGVDRIRSGLAGSSSLPTFIAYSRKDEIFLDQLRAALVPYERIRELEVWYDSLTEPGQLWEREILSRLKRARIIILLLSNDFLQSSYCMDRELPRAMERQARGECELIPIVIRACRYDKLDLGKIQAILPKGKPIDEHDKKDPAWEAVTRKLDLVLRRIKKA